MLLSLDFRLKPSFPRDDSRDPKSSLRCTDTQMSVKRNSGVLLVCFGDFVFWSWSAEVLLPLAKGTAPTLDEVLIRWVVELNHRPLHLNCHRCLHFGMMTSFFYFQQRAEVNRSITSVLCLYTLCGFRSKEFIEILGFHQAVSPVATSIAFAAFFSSFSTSSKSTSVRRTSSPKSALFWRKSVPSARIRSSNGRKTSRSRRSHWHVVRRTQIPSSCDQRRSRSICRHSTVANMAIVPDKVAARMAVQRCPYAMPCQTQGDSATSCAAFALLCV